MNMYPSKMNPVQLHLLQMFARPMQEKELADIKAMLVAYYDKLASADLDAIWEERNMDAETMDNLLNTHLRTPYKS